MSKEDYRHQFGLTAAAMKNFKASGLILHPGPINHAIEMDTEVLADPRSLVLEQVSSGVFVREALLRRIGGLA
jgi:aspartate carbamoyltransferase catalytic subunit